MSRVVSQREMVDFFKNSSLSVKDIADHAKEVGRPELAKAIQKADLNGDGKIEGATEAAALFKNLDDFDHDGSRKTISMKTKGLDALMQNAETKARPSSTSSRPSIGLRPGSGSPTGESTGRLDSGDTLSASNRPGSTLNGGQQLNRRYMGAGAVDVKTKDGKVGAFQWTGGMNVDTDGGTSREARSDRYYQSQTSMKFAGNKSLNSDNIPYVVLPPSLAKATGAKLGDLVEVKKNGKSMYAIYGDVGPSMKLGEGSLALAKAFDRRAGPNNGIDSGVTYTVLPGSGAAAGIRNGGPSVNNEAIQAAGEQAFARARDEGVVR